MPQKHPSCALPPAASSNTCAVVGGQVKKTESFIGAGVFILVLVGLLKYRPGLYVWAAAGAILFGAALVLEASRPSVKELGTGLLVAGFLALTLDPYLRRGAIEEVMKGVAPYYLTAGLPEQVADEIGYLRSVQLIRKNLEIRLWLRRESANSDSLTLETEMSYKLANYSPEPQPFRFRAGATGRSGRLVRASASGVDLAASEKYDTTFVAAPGQVTRFEHRVKIPPNKKDPQNTFVVHTVASKHAEDSETIFLVDDPSLNAEVELVDKPKDIHAEVYFGHRNPEDVEVLPKTGDPGHWSLNGVLLPWSAVYVEWNKKTLARP